MTQDLPLKTVSHTRETDPIDGWVYRIVENENGTTTIYRVPEHTRLWGHGILKQVYQPATGKFIPTSQVPGAVLLSSLAAAIAVILGR
jgi:hypothetical protein